MKFIIGPGVSDIKIIDKDGNDIVKELHIWSLDIHMEGGSIPELKAEMNLELFGTIHEIEIQEKDITAKLIRKGITQIESEKM